MTQACEIFIFRDKFYLKRLALNGLKRIGKFKDKIYRKRLAHEISVVIYHGFEDVFLATEDMVTWANNNGIQTGPGRGSGVSSLLAYCLGITKVDPIEYDLLFDRFLCKLDIVETTICCLPVQRSFDK